MVGGWWGEGGKGSGRLGDVECRGWWNVGGGKGGMAARQMRGWPPTICVIMCQTKRHLWKVES
jgi:hypothetical protein